MTKIVCTFLSAREKNDLIYANCSTNWANVVSSYFLNFKDNNS